MGRQHTTWISDETWERLANIEGDSISKKIRNAVKQADPDNHMIVQARLRQLQVCKDALRNIGQAIYKLNEGMEQHEGQSIDAIIKALDDCEHLLWEASA